MPAEGRIGAIPGWDSLGHMRLVLTLESRLGRALAAQEIVNLKSVADVRKLLA